MAEDCDVDSAFLDDDGNDTSFWNKALVTLETNCDCLGFGHLDFFLCARNGRVVIQWQ